MWPFRSRKDPPKEPSGSSAFRQVISPLTPETISEIGGIPPEAIAGELADRQFWPHPRFAEFLHEVIAEFGPRDPEFVEAAAAQGDGYLYIIDLRTPEGPNGNVPPQDIVGAFQVTGGRLGPYSPNQRHIAYTNDGLVCLPPSFAAEHLRRLRALKVS